MKKRIIPWWRKLSWQELWLFAFIIFMIVSHTAYVLISRQYPVWDENHYMMLAVGFYDLFHQNVAEILQKIWTFSDYRQPLYGFILSLPLFVFGTDHAYKIALFTNGLLYSVSIIGVYLLARQWCSKTTSLVAAMIFAWYGNVLFYLHYTYSEIAVGTCIVWATLFFVRSHFFTNRKFTCWAAVLTAAAVLTRWIAVPFLVGPLSVCGIGAVIMWVKNKKQRRAILYNLLWFFVLGVALPFFVYYLPNIKPFGMYLWRNKYYAPEWVAQFKDASMANPFSVRSMMFYFNIISQNTIFLFAPLVVGVVVAFVNLKKYIYPFALFVSGYGFLTIFAIWKEDRFIVPLYPIMAILSVLALDHIRNKWIRVLCVLYFVVVSTMSFFGASWAYGPMGHRGLTDIVLPEFIRHPRRIYLTPIVWRPNVEYVNVHQIMDAIIEDKKTKEKQLLIKTFTYDPVDNALNAIVLYEKRNVVTLQTVATTSAMMTDELWNKAKQEADYILTKTTPVPEMYKQNFMLLRSIFVPIDSSTLYLYKNNR